jgi:hypothetical protein
MLRAGQTVPGGGENLAAAWVGARVSARADNG